MTSLNKHAGFTLVEVMIAATILIASVATMTFVYQTAARSSMTASKNVELHSYVGLLINNVKSEVRQKGVVAPLVRTGQFGKINYRWQTTLIKTGAAPDKFDPDLGSWVKQPERFYLWQVNLVVTANEYSRDFVFKEFSWK